MRTLTRASLGELIGEAISPEALSAEEEPTLLGRLEAELVRALGAGALGPPLDGQPYAEGSLRVMTLSIDDGNKHELGSVQVRTLVAC